MHVPARTAAALLAALLTGGLLAGCSPPEEPVMAVGRDAGGRPVLHLRLCGDDDTVPRASLMLRGADPATSGTATSGTGSGLAPSGAAPSGSAGSGSASAGATGTAGPLWRIWNDTGVGRSWTIEIGSTPAGWRQEPDPSLPPGPIRLLPEQRYRLIASTTRPYTRDIVFTLADLDQLGDGQVWGYQGPRGQARALTLTQFRKQADDAC